MYVLLLYQNYRFRTLIQLPHPSSTFTFKPTTSLFSNICQHPKTQILLLLPPPWITATASISLCLSIVSQSSPSYSMSANYFEVIKTCFLLSLISIYCSLSLYPLQLFMEFCQFVAVGCSRFEFFCFSFHGILLVCGCFT